MNFEQLKAKVKFRVGNRTDIDNLIADNINRAYIDIATRERFVAGGKTIVFPQNFYFPTLLAEASFNTSNAIQSYTLADNVLWIIAMRNDTNNMPINLKTFRDFYRFIGMTTGVGSPTMAYYQNQKVWLYPIPDKSYKITYWYKKKPALLVRNTDTPELPEEWHEAVFLLAVAMTFFDLLEDERGNTHLMLLENFIIEHLGQEMAYFSNVSSKSA